MKAVWRILAVAAAVIAVPAAGRAQTAVMTAYLGNFDVVNNAGEDAHGFEIQFEGISPNDVWLGWSYERYGAAQVEQTAAGVTVRWVSPYDSAAQQFATRTVPYASGAKPFAGTCYMGSVTYDASGCEHFGISTARQATRATFRWLLADAQNPGALVGVDPPTAVVNPTYAIVPPAAAGAAPALGRRAVPRLGGRVRRHRADLPGCDREGHLGSGELQQVIPAGGGVSAGLTRRRNAPAHRCNRRHGRAAVPAASDPQEIRP